MRCLDSRRLTGSSLLLDGPGAILDIAVEKERADAIVASWARNARELLDAVGWNTEVIASRIFHGGASLALSAPLDALYAATEVNETAWAATMAEAGAGGPPVATVESLRQQIAAERRPDLVALHREAARRGITCLADDLTVSLGLGRGCQAWAIDDLPSPERVDWRALHDIPVALVTGTNGKTTTVRMLAAIATAAGLRVGNTSTDGVQIEGRTELEGDYTGPEGARALLRDRRIDMAVLEVARGGLLRRGLPLPTASAACVTNVGHDHLGEYGMDDVADLARLKLLVAKAIGDGVLVVSAHDRILAAAARELPVRREWVYLAPVLAGGEKATPASVVTGEEPVWTVDDGVLLRRADGADTPLLSEREVAATFGGVARHNTANALSAAALAGALGIPGAAIVAGLRDFDASISSHPGRGNLMEFGGLRVWFDFAHNPEGLETVLQMAAAMDAQRRLLVLGQAGDRDDASIDALARITARHLPDRVLLKEMRAHARGRAEGEVVRRLRTGLIDSGYPEERIETLESEIAAIRRALNWGEPHDLLLLLSHADRAAVADLLRTLAATGWLPGDRLPEIEEGHA